VPAPHAQAAVPLVDEDGLYLNVSESGAPMTGTQKKVR
jgi:hypothetical protein